MKNKIISVTAALILSASAASATVIYNEAVSGDLDAIGSTNVNLVLGVNEILGRVLGSPPEDSDRVKFTQVSNLLVDSITLSFTSAFDPQNIGTSFNLDLHNDQANLFDDNFLNASSGADILASFVDTFGPETGTLSTTTSGAIWDFQIAGGPVFPFQDWKLTINTSEAVAPVPLPATAPLILGALGGLAMMRRRKKR